MQNTLDLLKCFCRYDFEERDCEKAVSLLAKDICWFGTSDFEDVYSIDAAKAYIMSEIKALPAAYKITVFSERYMPSGSSSGVAFLKMALENSGILLHIRVTASSCMEAGTEKLCSMHFSVADSDQKNDEFFPISAHRDALSKAKRELIMSTMPGGQLGGYLQEGYPFYFINERMLQYLGYADETAFIADIDGLIINGMHPDDRQSVSRAVAAQLAAHPQYTVDYRMKKQDGSYIWVHDIGQATVDENGRDIIISVCYDVTQAHEKQAQLDAVVHNVPGGVCLYRWDGFQLHPIVVSEQLSSMLGGDATRAIEQTHGLMYKHVHPDDLPGLQQAILDAFHHTKKLDYTYRSLNSKTNHYIWIYVQGNVVPQADGTQLAYVSYTDITKERLMGQQLRASERALDAATEQAGLWYWNYEPSNNRAYFNPRCIRDFDLPQVLDNYPQAWLEQDFILPAYQAVYAEAVQQVKRGQPQVTFEAQVKFKDGVTHWAEFRFTNLPDEDGKQDIVICTGHLIDEEKALLAKYELEKQKPSLGEKNLLIHATFNLSTGETLDYAYAAVLGQQEHHYKTMTEAIARVAESIVDEDSKKSFLRLNDAHYLHIQLQQGNINFSMDYRREMPNGQIIWVKNIFHLVREPNSGALLLFEYCYDIHEQKMAEEVLYSATTYDYERIASVNFNIGKMMHYGALEGLPAERLLDYEAMRQDYAKNHVMPAVRAQFLLDTEPETVMARVKRDGHYGFTTKTLQPDGAVSIIKTRYVPYDLAHNIYILTRTDVTNILKEEEEKNGRLREALSVATQANGAKTDFLSAMSHDIRTPMNAIVGMCELALEDEHDCKQVHESLETIRSSSQLLLSLINNILDMSRIESGKMVLMNEPFSLTQQVKETAVSYQALAAQKQQIFHLHLNITHDACNGDIARIHSAIDNILSNAIKYTPIGGTITYRVSESPSGKAGIGLYRFEIADTGIGIRAEHQKHLFEPFYRGETNLTAKIEGTGLGLSIAKAIIDLKGGTISVKSAEGVGTTFLVELPLSFASARDVSAAHLNGTRSQAYDLTGVHILLCEDHPVNQKVVQRMLEKVHAKVTIAEDGQCGYLALTQSVAGTFDLILMDIQMPKRNGFETARAIRESGHPQATTIPIIALSANAFSEDVQKSLRAGMNDHLAKPVIPAQLYEMVLRHLRDKAKLNREKTKVLFVDDVE
ncbi:MAG: PAS domain-containing protein, partial [Oscillospiraceae bacterium]|nr:PAS domain-containing protein [Oscillospiraceae bacterium]